MAKKITELTPAAALDGTELVWLEQGGLPVKGVLHNGIAATDLLSRTVNEIVTGRWDFESDGSAPQLCIVDSDSNGAATRAFIEYLGKGDVLTGRMGYLTAASGIFTIDNALPNAGIELTNAGVQKLRIDINGVFMSDDTDISGALTVSPAANAAAFQGLIVNTTTGGDVGNSNTIFISAVTGSARGVYIGAERINTSNRHDMILATSANTATPVERVRIAPGAFTAPALAATFLSYDGILAANLMDKTAPETITQPWDFNSTIDVRAQVRIDGSGEALVQFKDETAPLDEKIWKVRTAGGQLQFQAFTDAGGFGANAILINRTGTSLDSLVFGAPLITQGNFVVEGETAHRSILRSERLTIAPGATPGTNINITVLTDQTGRGYNALGLTAASNLAKGGSSGSFSLNSGGTQVTIDVTPNIKALIGYSISLHNINNSSTTAGDIWFSFPQIATNNLTFTLIKAGTSSNSDMTSIFKAGDRMDINFFFITDS